MYFLIHHYTVPLKVLFFRYLFRWKNLLRYLLDLMFQKNNTLFLTKRNSFAQI